MVYLFVIQTVRLDDIPFFKVRNSFCLIAHFFQHFFGMLTEIRCWQPHFISLFRPRHDNWGFNNREITRRTALHGPCHTKMLNLRVIKHIAHIVNRAARDTHLLHHVNPVFAGFFLCFAFNFFTQCIAIIGSFCAFTYWFPKMFGKMMNDTLGKIHFWGTVIPFNFIFIPLFVLGMGGQHRRIYNFQHFPQIAGPEYFQLRELATIALLVMLAFQLVFFYNVISSWMRGEKAGKNPWKANTLEWTTESPAPHGNWPVDELPTVYRGPYEYGHPDREEDYWPQNLPN